MNSVCPVPDPTARYVIRTGFPARSSKISIAFQKYLDGLVVPEPCISIVVAASDDTDASTTPEEKRKKESERKEKSVDFAAAIRAHFVCLFGSRIIRETFKKLLEYKKNAFYSSAFYPRGILEKSRYRWLLSRVVDLPNDLV